MRCLDLDLIEKKEMKKMLEQKAELFKAISHPVRLCVLVKLLSEEVSNVTELQCCIDVSQSTISQHIAKLKAANIIAGVREGNEIFYRIVNKEIEEIIKLVLQFENLTGEDM